MPLNEIPWQAEILELMEANGVPEENIGKVLDLL